MQKQQINKDELDLCLPRAGRANGNQLQMIMWTSLKLMEMVPS